jgi:hypothetical protein
VRAREVLGQHITPLFSRILPFRKKTSSAAFGRKNKVVASSVSTFFTGSSLERTQNVLRLYPETSIRKLEISHCVREGVAQQIDLTSKAFCKAKVVVKFVEDERGFLKFFSVIRGLGSRKFTNLDNL